MLHLGRSSAGPGHGGSCFRSPKPPHSVSSCVYLWRMLNKIHPLFLRKQLAFGPFGHLQNISTRSGIPLSPSFARRKLAVARGFVTQEDADNGENGDDTFKIPPDLPCTVNSSSAVHSWGSIYQGPSEAKYYNSVKDFPYTVGYTCIKMYKGKEYCQSIEEGPQGPIFVVREAGLGVFQSDSPQKVWNKVSEIDGIRVHGMRHFGFENSEVIHALRAMISCSKGGHPQKRSRLKKSYGIEVDSSVDVPLTNSLAEEVDSENARNEAKFVEESKEGHHADVKAASVDEEGQIVALNDNDDSDFFGIENSDDGQYVEGDVILNVRNDDDVNYDVFHDSEDDDNDFGGGGGGEEEEEEEVQEEEDKKADDHLLSSHVYSDERMRPAFTPSTRDKVGGPSMGFKRSFKSGPRKVTFTRVSHGTDDVVKHDYAKEGTRDDTNNLVYNTPYAPKQKALPTAERQVWRKGEGLTGYIPKQQATEKARVDEQGEGLKGVVLGYDRQQAAERIRAGEQGEGLKYNVPGHNKQQETETVSIDDSRASSSFNYANLVNSWEGSALKRKEENPKSSQLLLELLNKWNKVKKWDHDSTDGPGLKVGKKHELSIEEKKPPLLSVNGNAGQASKEDINPLPSKSSTFSTRPRNILCQETSQIRFVKDEESVLDELCNSVNVDESTDFAVSKLFETEGDPHLLWDDGSSHSRHGKSSSNDSRNGVDASRGTEILNMDQSFLATDSLSGLMNRVQDGVVSSKFSEEKNNMISLAGKHETMHEVSNIAKSFVMAGEKETGHEPSNVTKHMYEAGEKGTRQEPSNVAKRVVEPPEDRIDVPKRGADEIRLIEEVRKLTVRKRFEDAFQKVKGMKLAGMTVDEDVYEAVLGFKLDPWQKEAFKQVNNGYSVLVSAPSGAGKSVVADCCLYNNVVNEQRALFVTPYEHLANQSLQRFERMLAQSSVGGTQTRMRTQKGPKLVVITLEMLSRILHELKGPGGSEFRFFFEGVNMVVLDKFCTFGETSHGRLWEEIFMLMDPKIQVIALTLPAVNEEEITSWISMNRGPCKLVSCASESIQRQYLFGHKSGIFPLLDSKGLHSEQLKIQRVNGNPMTKDHLESSLWSGYDKPSLMNVLNTLDVNAMLPALVIFLDAKSCDIAMQDALSDGMDGLLSWAEIEKVEMLFNEFGEKYSNIWKHIEKADREGLGKGFAVLHEGKLPLWQDFVIELFQENLVKVILVTESSLLHTELMARTVILPAICKVTEFGVSSIAHGQFLQLIGRAGRRGLDIEGNVVFLDSIYSGPQEAASLLLDNTFSFSSCFQPSYSLVVNLMAKHKIAEVKKILGRSFADFQFFTKHTKATKLKELDQDILNCLEAKARLDSKLFEGLAQVNKNKLSNAAMFTRVDIRMTIHLASHTGNALPGILLATVAVKGDAFYMVFGADNNFRLLPAGAFDHVYGNEVSPLDVMFKHATGQGLQPPAIPPKENWTVDQVGLFGYVASGNLKTKEYVRLMMQYPVQPHFARDCLQLRKDIIALEAKVSNLVEKRKTFQTKPLSLESNLKSFEGEATAWQVEESETWKAAVRLVNILQKVDALSIIDSQGAYVKLKPLGMLIARLHNVENELWLAMAVTSKYVKTLVPAEFAGLMATMIPSEAEVEGLFTDQRELSYRVTKSLKDSFAGLEVLRKQIAALQGSYSPPLQFDTAFAGLVYAWARGKPGPHGGFVMSPNDGDIAWKFRSITRLINSVYRACSQVSVDISEPNDFNNLSSLARRAEDMLSKHLTTVDRT